MRSLQAVKLLRFAVAFFIGTIIFIACKKDNYLGDTSVNPDETAEFVRTWLSKQKKDSIAVMKLNTQLVWKEAYSFKADSDKTYKVVPLPDTNTVAFEPGKVLKRYLVIKQVKDTVRQGYIYEIFGNKDDLTKKARTLISNFGFKEIQGYTGNLIKYSLRGGFDESAKYNSGVINERLRVRQKASAKAKIDELAKKNPNIMYCTTWYLFHYVNEVLVGADYLYSICTCEPQSMSIRDNKGNFKVVQTADCGGDGGGGSSDGSVDDCKYVIQSIKGGKRVTEVVNPCNPIPPPKPPKDPCEQKVKVQANAAEQHINAQIATLKAKSQVGGSNEWAGSVNISSLNGTGIYSNTALLEGPSPTESHPQFTWNSTNGYTTAFSHDHPAGSQPSPPDVFDFLVPFQSSDFIASGEAGKDFYKENFFITVVVYDATYMMMIKDFDQLQTLKNSYDSNKDTFMNTYYQEIANRQDAEAGLLAIFGNAVNIYKKLDTETTFKPLMLDAQGKTTTKDCPGN